MNYKAVTEQFAVAPQIAIEDIETIKSLGYVAIINNRPDGETEDQPTSKDIQATAETSGLKYYHLPITSGTLPSDAIEQTKAALTEIGGPTFAYCRSGTRSITLWALSQIGQKDPSEIIHAVKQAGYDLPYLEQLL